MIRLRSAILPLSLFATSLVPLACGGSDSPPAVCTELKSYTSSVPTQPSFATDVYPILTNTAVGGCAQVGACHGSSTIPIDTAGAKKLQFLYGTDAAPVMDPAMAKAQLLMASVNAPSMQRVTPGNVANSLMSYKISGKDGLSCISSMCTSGASIGTKPCGDAMPTIGMITASDRTKILDWIAAGAVD